MKLKISDSFSLPLELATGSIAMLAIKGSGKTYTSAVLTEELIARGVPVIIIDPTGVHWGLKSSASGKSEGLSVTIFGGDHADLPLEEGSGEVLARWAVEKRFSAIIDLSHFRKSQIYRFLTPFLETLYRLNRQPIHLVCDEADSYAPQKSYPDVARCLGAMEDIIRRGRARGIGSTLISQRPASLNKDVLTQCDCLVALRISHPRDIAPVMEWVDQHGDRAQAKQMVETLPSLKTGTAWIWAPRNDIFEKVDIRSRETFDSSVTPKIGQVRIEPKVMAKIDLQVLGEEIKSTVDRAKENDPSSLKKEITRLKSDLSKKPETTVQRVEVPILDKESSALITDCRNYLVEVKKHISGFESMLSNIEQRAKSSFKVIAVRPIDVTRKFISRSEIIKQTNHDDQGLSNGERKILTVLAQYTEGKETTPLAHLSGYTVNGHFNNMLGALRSKGLVEQGQPVRINQNGLTELGDFEPLPTGEELRKYWLKKVSNGEAKILGNLFDLHPTAVPISEIAEASGYTINGHFNNMLGHLRTMELVEGRGNIKASDYLFE